MKISVTVKKEVTEEIEIITPAYFKSKYGSGFVKITEHAIIQVFNHGIDIALSENNEDYFQKEVGEIVLRNDRITEKQFLSAYDNAFEIINTYVRDECESCDGSGQRSGTTVNADGFEGYDWEGECEDCNGTGKEIAAPLKKVL